MRLGYILTCFSMTLRELGRAKVALILGFLVPPLFFAVAAVTSGEDLVAIRLAAAASRELQLVDPRSLSYIFLGLAAAGLLSAFFAASLIQRRVEVNRRLVLCGYTASELILARLAVLIGILSVTGLYMWLLLALLVQPRFPAGVTVGILLGAFVYGAYGLLVGTVFRRDLESILSILVLINIDAGWLQNALYYEKSAGRWLIESLPGHCPAQVAYLSAFTSDSTVGEALCAVAYGCAFLAVAMAIYVRRLRVLR